MNVKSSNVKLTEKGKIYVEDVIYFNNAGIIITNYIVKNIF